MCSFLNNQDFFFTFGLVVASPYPEFLYLSCNFCNIPDVVWDFYICSLKIQCIPFEWSCFAIFKQNFMIVILVHVVIERYFLKICILFMLMCSIQQS